LRQCIDPFAIVKKVCIISKAGKNLPKAATEKLGLFARAYERILKMSRTIVDLASPEEIQEEHLAKAIQCRSLDREDWGG
jgi:magnesium chelatase family protein